MRPTLLAAFALLAPAACSKASSEPEGNAGPAPAAVTSAQIPVQKAQLTDPKPEANVPAKLPDDFASIWNTPIKTLDGKPTTLASFRGKEILVVNVASKCGLTPQYTQFEALQKQYEAKGFTIVGFPCNQFGGQEPGSAEEIKEF